MSVTEKNDIETVVVEEEKSVESKTDGDGDTEIQFPEAEEPQVDVQTDLQSPVTTELEVDENIPTENYEIAATENDGIPVLKDEDKVHVVEV